MRSWLGAFTTRGTSFLAAGVAATLAGLLLSERDLVSIGVLLMVLPLFSALAASRARYRLSCTRNVVPRRVAAGQTAQVRLRLQNVSRLPTGLLLAEDTVPYALGTRPRYVLNGIERGGSRDLSYPVRSDLRGKFTVGPLEIRVADAFGLVELGHSFSSRTPFVVTPKVVPLPRAVVSASWLGDGEARTRTAAAAGEDDVVPRAYRDGDELRRVHWRSTARYGELMVRREEQQWRNRVLLLLDTRRGAHAGSGATSSFEFAVSAAASIGTHLAREGLDGQLITDTGPVAAPGSFEEVLLNSLAVITQSRRRELDPGLTALRGASGLLVAVVGRLSADNARRLAACRRDAGPAIALLLSVSTWAAASTGANEGAATGGVPADGAGSRVAGNGVSNSGPGHSGAANSSAANSSAANSSAANSSAANGSAANGSAANGSAASRAAASGGAANGGAASRLADGARPAESPETSQAAMILRAAGWRVTTVDASMPLATAWQRLALSPGDPGAGRWVADLPPAARTDGSGSGNSHSSTLPGGTPGAPAPGTSREAGQDA
jgi:uncharacterized protein (DUF58 family)